MVTLVGPGVPEIFEACPETAPALIFDPRGQHIAGYPNFYLPPVGRPAELGERRGAFGGSFAFTSDSRFRDLMPGGGPIPIHDRVE